MDDIVRQNFYNLNYMSDLSILTVRDIYYFPFIRIEPYGTNNFSHVEEIFEIATLIIKEGIITEDLTLEEKSKKYVYLFEQNKSLLKKKGEFDLIVQDVDNDHKNLSDFSDKPLRYYDKYADYLFTAKENIRLINNFFSDCVEILNIEMANYEKQIVILSEEISKLSKNLAKRYS